MRRLGVVVVATLVAFAGVLVVPATSAAAAEGDDDGAGASDVTVTRYAGADRYETSLRVAEAVAAEAEGSLEWVVLVSGRRWTDAVVAAPVAGALGAPVLMTPPDELRADALAFLQRVGVSKALVVGPDASSGAHGPGRGVGDEVFDALDDAGISAERVAGDDRFGTGVAAAGRVTPGAMGDLGRTAIIASGDVFADALVAGPFAARGIHPVLLSPPGELHADVAGYLGEAGIEHVVLMGGTAALSDAVEQAVEDLGIDVSRVAGSTRYDTAVKAAELAADQYSATAGKPCFADNTVGVARARVPFDSFSAAPLLGRLCAPLVLADPGEIPEDTAAYLDAAREAHDAVGLRVFGGDAAVSQAAIDAYLTGEEPVSDDKSATDQADEADDQADEADDGEPSTAPGVLPAGTCGGSIDDEPRQLISSANAEDPAWSPDCSQIIFTQDGALWTVDNDGSNPQRILRRSDGYLASAAWSPDGDKIAYASGRQVGSRRLAHIWVMNPDGSDPEKLTHNDVSDRSPRWSPDGETIVFDRYDGTGRFIARMNRAGKQEKALTNPRWDFAPVFSPDGSQLAFIDFNTIVIASADPAGAEFTEADLAKARHVIGNVYWNGGLDWSPDGERLAFVRGDSSHSQIVIADINGLNEEVVFDYEGQALAPRWSPDGQLIAFHTIDSDGSHRAYVSGASGEKAVEGAAQCRPLGVSATTAGFPLPGWAVPSIGTLRVAVLFMDFPDAEASHSTEEEAAQGLPYVEEYLEAASYGQLDVELMPHHVWLRSERPYGDFVGTNQFNNQAVASGAITHAIDLAAAEVDVADVDTVMVVLAGNHFGGGGFAHPSVSTSGGTWPATLVNSVHLGAEREPYTWGSVASHELTHSLGLADLYPYDTSAHARPDPPSGKAWVASEWGRMNMWAYFLADEDDPRLAHRWEYPDGGVATSYKRHLRIEEMLAWSRWQLGWLSQSQVSCLGALATGEGGAGDAGTVTVALSPVAQPGDGIAMAAVPLNSREMIVVESRRKLGYDAGRFFQAADTGASTTFPRLITEGVLVYTVDSLLRTGRVPLRVAGDSGNGVVSDFPVLGPGDSVTLHGYTITVTADDGDTHTVAITRSD